MAMAAILTIGLTSSIAFAQITAAWGNLQPGPYGVGFNTIESYDYSRTFLPKYDYYGIPLAGIRARPIQICYWYPATVPDSARKMVYGEYQFAYPENLGFIDILSRIQARDIANLHIILNNDQGLVLDYLSIEMAAMKNAPAVEGLFPLLIYCPNYRGYYTDNLLLCEYLASYGFVVATTHPLGTKAVNAEFNLGDLETLIEDKQFVLARVRDLPFVDIEKIGVFGYGSGGLEALLLPMRNSDIDASLSLPSSFDGESNDEFIAGYPYFSDMNFTVPFMWIHGVAMNNHSFAVFDSLRYSTRYSLAFRELPEGAFTSYRIISRALPGGPADNQANLEGGYDIISRYARRFFDAYLNKNTESINFLVKTRADNSLDQGYLELSMIVRQQMPPTASQFMAIITDKGIDTAITLYQNFKKQYPERIFFQEAPMNALGYQLLQTGQTNDAIEIFKINTEAYLNSANTWDSYAEALIAAGNIEGGKKALRKALEVMPGDTVSSEQLKEAIRAHANQVLRESETR